MPSSFARRAAGSQLRSSGTGATRRGVESILEVTSLDVDIDLTYHDITIEVITARPDTRRSHGPRTRRDPDARGARPDAPAGPPAPRHEPTRPRRPPGHRAEVGVADGVRQARPLHRAPLRDAPRHRPEPLRRDRPTGRGPRSLSLIHISEPTRLGMNSYAVFCLKKQK